MVATGATNKEIGARLFRTERTVEGHLDRIRAKLDLKSRVEIAAWANAHGLAPASDQEKGTLAGPPSRTRTRSN